MAVALETWLDLIDREYLRPFICEGGSAVKFVEGDAGQLDEVRGASPVLRSATGSCPPGSMRPRPGST